MNISLEPVTSESRILHTSCGNGVLLFVYQAAEGKAVISISARDQNTQNKLVSTEKPVLLEARIGEATFGTCALFAPECKFIFASLHDQKRLTAFRVPQSSGLITSFESVHELGFDNPLLSLKLLRNRIHGKQTSVIAAVSTAGEICLLAVEGERLRVKKKRLDFKEASKVLSVSSYGDGHLVFVCVEDAKMFVRGLRFEKGSSLDAITVASLAAIRLPPPPPPVMPSIDTETALAGFTIAEDCAFILYKGGYVQILSPDADVRQGERRSLNAWFREVSGEGSHPAEQAVHVRHAFRLSPCPEWESGDPSSNVPDIEPVGPRGVVQLGCGYVAVGYGRYISIWDGKYCVGHSYVEVPRKVRFLLESTVPGRCYAILENSLEEVTLVDRRGVPPLTLGAAVKRKGSCDEIVVSIQKDPESAPMRSQPVIVGPIKAAAESGGNISRIFRQLMEVEDEQEAKTIRALLSKEATPSAGAVTSQIKEYTERHRRVRRGNRGKLRDSGLAKLPSERLAAVTVARCLYEISFGDPTFLVPFIDMIGTGVVSRDAVLSILSVSDSWKMGPGSEPLSIESIVDPLLVSGGYGNALEAVLARVSDLTEADVVRVLQFSVRMIKRGNTGEAKEGNERRKSEAQGRLLKRCLACGVDKRLVVNSVKKLPFSDVMACLEIFEEMLGDDDYRGLQSPTSDLVKTSNGLSPGSAGDVEGAIAYRGLRNWVSSDNASGTGAQIADELEGCVTWACHVVDGHLATLILDDAGRSLARRLLEAVRIRREESQALKGLLGLTTHLAEKKPVPRERDGSYRVTIHEAPQYAGLL